MKSGKIVLVEAKGDDRDNSDSKKKLKLGKLWQVCAGVNYRYFMVFDQNAIEDAYKLDDFKSLLENM
jgi:type III restriction enzyme